MVGTLGEVLRVKRLEGLLLLLLLLRLRLSLWRLGRRVRTLLLAELLLWRVLLMLLSSLLLLSLLRLCHPRTKRHVTGRGQVHKSPTPF